MIGLIMAFDFGLRYIGVAVGQAITGSANGETTLLCPKPKGGGALTGIPQWREVTKLIELHKPSALVVGLPLNMDGSEMVVTEPARSFAKSLEQRYQMPVYFHDERLTTKAAAEQFAEAKAIGRAKTEHELAACLILEGWFSENQTTT